MRLPFLRSDVRQRTVLVIFQERKRKINLLVFVRKLTFVSFQCKVYEVPFLPT